MFDEKKDFSSLNELYGKFVDNLMELIEYDFDVDNLIIWLKDNYSFDKSNYNYINERIELILENML